MLHSPLLIPPCATFWDEVAKAIFESDLLPAMLPDDLSAIRIVVPTFSHAHQLKAAMATHRKRAFIPPRITTLSAWLSQQAPTTRVTSDRERLMVLYAALRQQAWLKKLFTARRNTDLLPLAQTLLALCDELSQALLPELRRAPDATSERWDTALEQLSPIARHVLSDEAKLVWSIWKSQLGADDANLARLTQMMHLAERADAPLLWITPLELDAFEATFLQAYGKRQEVLPVMLDWRAGSFEAAYATAWPALIQADGVQELPYMFGDIASPAGLAIIEAKNLEDEATRGAQTIIEWIQSGKSRIGIVAQDRVVARRMRALLERAQIFVTDETGWKLSTTRAAAALAAWFEVVAGRAETVALLDFLKSPFVFSGNPEKPALVMTIEMMLRRAKVSGGWGAVNAALQNAPPARDLVSTLAQQAALFSPARQTLAQWIAMTNGALEATEMRDALVKDAAGEQVLALFEAIANDCGTVQQTFSFAEWRAFVNLQFEATTFIPPQVDNRVVMLPLNGARFRTFDAVLMVGADGDHFPSQLNETLFFANAVRRELGLATRETRQRQQLRDFAELLHSNRNVVVSWQSYKDGEPNRSSPWIERLQLVLERAGVTDIPVHSIHIEPRNLTAHLTPMPMPSAPQLLPEKLSASGYNSLVACPYQFFVTRMLGLSGLDELSDMPEKRDYGDWLHQILKLYHDQVQAQKTPPGERASVLEEITEKIFAAELAKSGAALGYYTRWQKTMAAYLAWANEREALGWQFMIGEDKLTKTLSWESGQITLYGRIDRIDENAAGERAVLDYKTKNQSSLKGKFKQLEDHQLAFYGLLTDVPADSALYVALEPTKGKTGDAEAPNYGEWHRQLREQVIANMRGIAEGKALPASGTESVCQYCDVRGLCRKGAW
jgi:ATP-dependent helicase/nuclease subunit B